MEKLKNQDDYVVYSMKLAKHLCRKGFEWKRVAVDKMNNTKVIFYFEKTPEIVNEIELYMEALKNEKNITRQ